MIHRNFKLILYISTPYEDVFCYKKIELERNPAYKKETHLIKLYMIQIILLLHSWLFSTMPLNDSQYFKSFPFPFSFLSPSHLASAHHSTISHHIFWIAWFLVWLLWERANAKYCRKNVFSTARHINTNLW